MKKILAFIISTLFLLSSSCGDDNNIIIEDEEISEEIPNPIEYSDVILNVPFKEDKITPIVPYLNLKSINGENYYYEYDFNKEEWTSSKKLIINKNTINGDSYSVESIAKDIDKISGLYNTLKSKTDIILKNNVLDINNLESIYSTLNLNFIFNIRNDKINTYIKNHIIIDNFIYTINNFQTTFIVKPQKINFNYVLEYSIKNNFYFGSEKNDNIFTINENYNENIELKANNNYIINLEILHKEKEIEIPKNPEPEVIEKVPFNIIINKEALESLDDINKGYFNLYISNNKNQQIFKYYYVENKLTNNYWDDLIFLNKKEKYNMYLEFVPDQNYYPENNIIYSEEINEIGWNDDIIFDSFKHINSRLSIILKQGKGFENELDWKNFKDNVLIEIIGLT
jgi:hypothetical protein